ncbi:TRAP transporter large permease subunit [Limnobacter sp.]|uniref:TRAP transporter large permease subunit n=1 Tax=Limnobacter sp. TaxID=2003368 RepID=UPI003511194C
MQSASGKKWVGRSPSEWLSSLPIFSLLLLTLIIGTGEMVHGQLLRLGERMFGDPQNQIQYFLLRADPEKPSCDPNPDIDALVAKQVADAESAPKSDLDLLFGDTAIDPNEIRMSLEAARDQCQDRYDLYERVSGAITPEVKMFREIETGFFGIFKFGTENRPLILLIMVAIAAVTTTLSYHHISLRPPRYKKDFQVYSLAMLGANLLMTISSAYYLKLQYDSGVAVENPLINIIAIALFAGLSYISLRDVLKIPEHAEEGGSYGLGLLSIPLYAFMALNAGINFFMDDYLAGLAIYFGQITELSSIFLNLALYLWAGMLLKQTRMVSLFMDILRPWKLPPEVFTWIVLLAAAVPTAYTGASGVFVIAAGAIVYREVLAVGARRHFALAATAMSGSLGVVLRPCLLIVVIAALNKEVTTSELYGWGLFVFILTSTIFMIIALLKAEGRVTERAKAKDALPQSLRALVPVSPYILIMLLVVFGYEYLLDTKLDEFTAPVMLPVIMLFVIIFDKLRGGPTKVGGDTPAEKKQNQGLEYAVRAATTETIGHIGALIMLMALSISVGGMIERSGLMSAVPADMGSIWTALTIFMFMMIFIGMVMDPFGAVILVSATVAPIAYSNGIHPVHFWMIVITAFELGYLSPPVALNQLLARQVVGEAEMDKAAEETKHRPFYYRYERWVLPVYTLFIGLVIVTYGGQAMINNADKLQPVSHFLGLDALRPAVLDQTPAAPKAPPPAPVAEPDLPPADELLPQEAADVLGTEASAPSAGGEAASAPVVAAPVAPPAPSDAAVAQTEVTEMVSNWAAAWSARDVEGYLSFYSQNFELPGQLSRSEWESQRRARIAGKKNIEVETSNLNVQVNGDTATVEFDQFYKADSYSDNVRKTLRLAKEGGRWRIVTEQSI